MGVKNLWDILEPCKKTLPLHHLQNKRVCIDLSCWMVQLQSVNRSHCALKEKVYLRGLFHRLRALISLNCSVILVTDGAIPAVKLSTYRRRLNSLNEVTQDDVDRQTFTSLRRNAGSEFSCMIREAKTLAVSLGIPCLDGIEEAEAQCALLNSESLCEGCFTSDSDVFLFGARTVYRDICLDKGGFVVCYEMNDIEKKLGLGRKSLVAISLLLGSDYSHGVRGFGPDSAYQVVKSISEDVVLQRVASDGISFLTSLKISKKNAQLHQHRGKENFADPRVKTTGDQPRLGKDNEVLTVIEAYMKPKCHSADSDPVYRVLSVHPFQRAMFQEICSKFFDWPPEKADEYILPKIAERELRKFAILRSSSSRLGVALPIYMMPMKCPVSEVLKHRRVQGKGCFEVSWEDFDGLKTSVVPADLVERACPEKIAEFEERKAQAKKQNRRKPRSKKTDDSTSVANVDTQLQSLLLDFEHDDHTRFRPTSEHNSCKQTIQEHIAPFSSVVELSPDSPLLDTEFVDTARFKPAACLSASGISVEIALTSSDMLSDEEYGDHIYSTRFRPTSEHNSCKPTIREDIAPFSVVDLRHESPLLGTEFMDTARPKSTTCSSSSASGSCVEIDLTTSDMLSSVDLRPGSSLLDTEFMDTARLKPAVCSSSSASVSSIEIDLTVSDFVDTAKLKPAARSSSSASETSVEIDLSAFDTLSDEEFGNKIAHFDSRPASCTLRRSIEIGLEHLGVSAINLDEDHECDSSSGPTSDCHRSMFPTRMETEVIDLLSPSPLLLSHHVSRCQGGNGNVELVNVIDLSDSDMEISPEHTQKAKELRVFLANIR